MSNLFLQLNKDEFFLYTMKIKCEMSEYNQLKFTVRSISLKVNNMLLHTYIFLIRLFLLL